MTANDPLEPLSKLRERLEEKTSPMGLQIERFLIEPTAGEAPNVLHVIFTIDLEDVGKDAEQKAVDDQFAALTRGLEEGIARQSDNERVAEAREDLRKMLDNHRGGGFLGDDPAPTG